MFTFMDGSWSIYLRRTWRSQSTWGSKGCFYKTGTLTYHCIIIMNQHYKREKNYRVRKIWSLFADWLATPTLAGMRNKARLCVLHLPPPHSLVVYLYVHFCLCVDDQRPGRVLEHLKLQLQVSPSHLLDEVAGNWTRNLYKTVSAARGLRCWAISPPPTHTSSTPHWPS